MVAMKNMRLLMNREARLWWHNIDERIAWDTTIWHRPAKEQLDCCRLDTGLPQPKLVLPNNIGGRQSHHQHNYARRWTQSQYRTAIRTSRITQPKTHQLCSLRRRNKSSRDLGLVEMDHTPGVIKGKFSALPKCTESAKRSH